MASYNWLKATLLQAKGDTLKSLYNDIRISKRIIKKKESELKKISNKEQEEYKKKQEELNDYNKQLEILEKNQELIGGLTEKDKQRTQEKAQKDFISSANWSWNTEDVLRLMEEGLVPTDLVGKILNDGSCFNNIWCWFNDKVSLKHLIAAKNIQILSYKNKCVALNPERSHDENEIRIKELFGKTKLNLKDKNVNLNITIHGTGGYVDDFIAYHKQDLLQCNNNVILTLSNIPSGFLATNSGIEERVNIGKYNVLGVIKIFNDCTKKESNEQKSNQEGPEQRQQNQEIQNEQIEQETEDIIKKKNKIIISSVSFGNLFAALLSKELTKESSTKIDVLNMNNFPWSIFHAFQSIDDLANTLNDKNCKENIKEVWIPDRAPGIHYKCLAIELRRSLDNLYGKQFTVKNMEYLNDGKIYAGDWEGNKMEGNGTLYTYNSTYTGEFKNNSPNGKGQKKCKKNDCVVTETGTFRNDVLKNGTQILEYNDSIHVRKGTFGSNFKGVTIVFNQQGKCFFINNSHRVDEQEELLQKIKEYNLTQEECFTEEEIEYYKKKYQDYFKIESSPVLKQDEENNIFNNKIEESEDIKINTKINNINNIEASEDKEYLIDNNKSINHVNSKRNLISFNYVNKIKLK